MTSRGIQMGAWAVVLLLAAGGAAAEKGSQSKQRAEKLASEARELAKPRGCDKVQECELAGFGSKSCGGPREYLAYCSRTTDVKALREKLEALEKAEREWQSEAGVMSDCGLTRKPRLKWVDGECRAR